VRLITHRPSPVTLIWPERAIGFHMKAKSLVLLLLLRVPVLSSQVSSTYTMPVEGKGRQGRAPAFRYDAASLPFRRASITASDLRLDLWLVPVVLD